MNERVDSFGDLSDFTPSLPKPKVKTLEVAAQVAGELDIPTCQPVKQLAPRGMPAPAVLSAREPSSATHVVPKEQLPSRRRTTGRSEQVNIKTTFAAKKRLMEISVARDMPLGEVLEQALEALERSWQK